MSSELVLGIYVLILAAFVGFEVIARVPAVLHTPLLRGLGVVAVALGAANVFGGFVVTDRMLEMFKGRVPGEKKEPAAKDDGAKRSK